MIIATPHTKIYRGTNNVELVDYINKTRINNIKNIINNDSVHDTWNSRMNVWALEARTPSVIVLTNKLENYNLGFGNSRMMRLKTITIPNITTIDTMTTSVPPVHTKITRNYKNRKININRMLFCTTIKIHVSLPTNKQAYCGALHNLRTRRDLLVFTRVHANTTPSQQFQDYNQLEKKINIRKKNRLYINFTFKINITLQSPCLRNPKLPCAPPWKDGKRTKQVKKVSEKIIRNNITKNKDTFEAPPSNKYLYIRANSSRSATHKHKQLGIIPYPTHEPKLLGGGKNKKRKLLTENHPITKKTKHKPMKTSPRDLIENIAGIYNKPGTNIC